MPETTNPLASNPPSVAVVVPDATRRRTLVTALADSQVTVAREFGAYPSAADVAEIARLNCSAVIVDLDGDAENALQAIRVLCDGNASMTVMAYSGGSDADLMRRSMEAGAREFLVEPLRSDRVNEAIARAVSRTPDRRKAPGKVLVFLPSKGGVGTTTIALNFALALKKESGATVVLVDLDFELGEVALGLGMTAPFSVVDALQNPTRLDKEFLSTLLLRHNSGLAILASSEEYTFFNTTAEGAARLFRVLRDEFTYVVVDAGTAHGHVQQTLFDVTEKVYLMTELTFPALRNAHRIIAFLAAREGGRGLEVVVNRSNSLHFEIDETNAIKALGRPINWRIPNDYAAARVAQDTGVPLEMKDNPITRVLAQMAAAACGKPPLPERKRGLFDFFRLAAEKAGA